MILYEKLESLSSGDLEAQISGGSNNLGSRIRWPVFLRCQKTQDRHDGVIDNREVLQSVVSGFHLLLSPNSASI